MATTQLSNNLASLYKKLKESKLSVSSHGIEGDDSKRYFYVIDKESEFSPDSPSYLTVLGSADLDIGMLNIQSFIENDELMPKKLAEHKAICSSEAKLALEFTMSFEEKRDVEDIVDWFKLFFGKEDNV